MFDFTTQTIINDVTNQVHVNKVGNDVKSVRVRNIVFVPENIESIEYKKATPESLSSVTFDLAHANITETGTYRFFLYVNLHMTSQDSFYANDLVYKGRPFYVEFDINDVTPANLGVAAKRAVAVAKKFALFQNEETLMNISANGTEVKFECVNGHQMITKAYFQFYDPDAKTVDCCSKDGDYVNLLEGVPAVWTLGQDGKAVIGDSPKYVSEDGTEQPITPPYVPIKPGVVAFGDYNWMIHNLRLPTLENTSYWSSNKEQMPAVGATYAQFCVKMCVKRDKIAGEVVGQRAISVTNHIFYVNSNDAGTFKTYLENLLANKEVKVAAITADTALNAPFTNLPESNSSEG